MGLGLGQCDHINRMITLSVITLSGFHCSLQCYKVSQTLHFDWVRFKRSAF